VKNIISKYTNRDTAIYEIYTIYNVIRTSTQTLRRAKCTNTKWLHHFNSLLDPFRCSRYLREKCFTSCPPTCTHVRYGWCSRDSTPSVAYVTSCWDRQRSAKAVLLTAAPWLGLHAIVGLLDMTNNTK